MATKQPAAPRKRAATKAAAVAAKIPPEPVPPVWHQSATVRMVIAAIAAVVLWQLAKSYGESPWPLVRPWLTGEDGLLIKSFGYKLAFGLLALTMWWQNQRSRYRSNGLNFRKDVWPLLVAGNMAVATWVAGGAIASALLLGMVL